MKPVNMILSERFFEIEKEKILKKSDVYQGWIADIIYKQALIINNTGYKLTELTIPKNYFYEMLLQIKGIDGEETYDSIITSTEFGELKINPIGTPWKK